ncbi:MAG: hypothetical protein IMZ44_08360 [Planctomycetes bacterium]|nr:hypothetical protein [Planctomycetota bacterium]
MRTDKEYALAKLLPLKVREGTEALALLACNEVREFLRGVLCLEMTVKTIHDRHFDGHAVVFPPRAIALNWGAASSASSTRNT